MSTLLNRPNNTQSPNPETEHNSRIHERYQRLQNLEAEQFAQMDAEAQQAPVQASRAAVLTPERVEENRVAQAPSVTEYERRASDFSLFTTETLDRVLERNTVTETPVQNVLEMPTLNVETAPVPYAAVTEAALESEAYGLTGRGKAVIGAFCGFVCSMLCVIGINSGIIARNEAKIQALETTRQELLLEKANIQANIDEITSEENVSRWAIENGWVKAN